MNSFRLKKVFGPLHPPLKAPVFVLVIKTALIFHAVKFGKDLLEI